MMLGLGHDVVDIAAFATQLEESGGGTRRLFSPRELRQAAIRAQAKHDGEAVHLAAKWAGKEAVLKAWCEALSAASLPLPYAVDDFPWPQVEILDDSRGVPHVALAADPQRRLTESLFPLLHGGGSSDDESVPAAVVVCDDGARPMPARVSSGRPLPSIAPASDRSDRSGRFDSEAFGTMVCHLSLSHDGPIASAVVILAAVFT